MPAERIKSEAHAGPVGLQSRDGTNEEAQYKDVVVDPAPTVDALLTIKMMEEYWYTVRSDPFPFACGGSLALFVSALARSIDRSRRRVQCVRFFRIGDRRRRRRDER
ncbi:MAG TPA: hypothetical protein VHG72_08590 [Polyangia bacterium]|nr:hypothetical protein [Polyangia bacterium]